MAARKIQFHYRFYLNNIRTSNGPDFYTSELDLTDYIHYKATGGINIKCIDFNKIKNKTFNSVVHRKLISRSVDCRHMEYNIAQIAGLLRQIRVCALGTQIGRLILSMGDQVIIDKTYQKKEICLYMNSLLSSYSPGYIKFEYPVSMTCVFCLLNPAINSNVLALGKWKSWNGIALSHFRYSE